MEQIIIYHKDDFTSPIPIKRKIFYTNRRQEYSDDYISFVDLWLINNHGEILLQKRSPHKTAGGLYHNSVGGHNNVDETPNFSITHECIEEIGVAPYVCDNIQDYDQAIMKLRPYTDRVALITPIYSQAESVHITEPDGSIYKIQDFRHQYFGIYNGPVTNLDRSAEGFMRVPYERLIHLITTQPEQLTQSVRGMIMEHGDQLKKFIDSYTH